MPAHSSWQLIVSTMQTTVALFRRERDKTIALLENDGSSRIVNFARSDQMRMVMVAVGGFSMLEGILEQTRGWSSPFKRLDQELRAKGHISIADEFLDFRLAVNVLKHGSGDSYKRLLIRENLPFRVKMDDEHFFNEGDVSEIPSLVLVDDDFVYSCAVLIEKCMIALGSFHLDVFE